VLRRGLLAGQAKFRAGERSAAKLRAVVAKAIGTAPLGRVDYIEVVSAGSLQPTRKVQRGDTIALAVLFGKTRLIDNLQLR
jgi:pantoate--beta-alanine ligase